MGCNGRGPDRPAASTGNGLVTFRDADWNCACAYNVTRSLTRKMFTTTLGLISPVLVLKLGFRDKLRSGKHMMDLLPIGLQEYGLTLRSGGFLHYYPA